MPGRRYSPVRRRISAATLPAWRMRSIISGDLMRGSSQWIGTPDSAYGGRSMWSGTVRIGETAPCSTRPSERLWHRLYLRPLPHQHGSLACGSSGGGFGNRSHQAIQSTNCLRQMNPRDRRGVRIRARAGRSASRRRTGGRRRRSWRRLGRPCQNSQAVGTQPPSAPVRRARHRSVAEPGLDLGDAARRARRAIGDRLRLRRRPRPDLARARPGGEVVVALGGVERARSCPRTRTWRCRSSQPNVAAATGWALELAALDRLVVREEREARARRRRAPAPSGRRARRRRRPSTSVIAFGSATPASKASPCQRRHCSIGSAVDVGDVDPGRLVLHPPVADLVG